MKKKVAVLYYGIHQNYCFNECFLNFKKMVIEPNSDKYEFDIFMHRFIDKNTWYPWKNSDKINKDSMNIDYKFINDVVKPKIFKTEPIIDFIQEKYYKILGDKFVYKYNLIYDTEKKLYIIYNTISRAYSIYKINKLKNIYQNNNNIKYDIVIVQESNTYFFEKLLINNYNTNILNISGYWNKKVPNIFNTKESNNFMPKGLYDIFLLSNNDIINIYSKFFYCLKFYYTLPIQTCNYMKFNYHQHGYLIWKHIKLNKIKFEKINLILGIYRVDGVKINLETCPNNINLVNVYERKDGLKLSDDARDYISLKF